jgi:trehalose 6-phosphate synthase
MVMRRFVIGWIGESPKMSLIIVSNRVCLPKTDEPIAGGLAAALLPAVSNSGAIWIGSSGRLCDRTDGDGLAEVQALGTGAVAMIDLPAAHYRGFYEGFANSCLWPALHSRADLLCGSVADYTSYREVNAFMARALMRFAKPDATFWIHDYHFVTLAEELRRLGVDRPIGFFLHTPFPSRSVAVSLPHHHELTQAMLSYDLVGFQTDEDLTNFADYLRHELGVSVVGDLVRAPHGMIRLASFPIGIDVKAFAERAMKSVTRAEVARLRSSLQGAKLVIGVDRVDYSKGLTNRLMAFDRMLDAEPQLKRTVSMLQIAVPSRGQIEAYRHLQRELSALVGEINGRHGEVDWTPIRYLNKAFGQAVLAGFYRVAGVGLITSLHDGMNLVAKEYVAAQDRANPGVLVLSEFAGAAKQLDAALLVNPHDIDGLARTVARALVMSIEERRARCNAMMTKLEDSQLDGWFSDFVEALTMTRARPHTATPADQALVPFRPRRNERSAAQLH